MADWEEIKHADSRIQSDQVGDFSALHFIESAKRATMSKCDVALALTCERVGEPPRMRALSVFASGHLYIAADYSSADQTSSKYTTIITTRYFGSTVSCHEFYYSVVKFQYLLTILKKKATVHKLKTSSLCKIYRPS